MSDFDVARDVCFVGNGNSAQCHYRVLLPAEELGADWCGVFGQPPRFRWATGMARDEDGERRAVMPSLGSYKVVVVQQVVGDAWLRLIRLLQEKGIKVVYETDDYVHGIRRMRGEHDHYMQFDDKYLARVERCMKACDALIGSTEFIASRYSHFTRDAYVCQNGIDAERYRLTRPPRATVNIGWSGGTGHNRIIIPWFQEAAKVMQERSHTCFISIGQDFGLAFEKWFGKERSLAIPWTAIEQYPGAMTMFDIALAPGGRSGFWRGKSDLRWLEAGALGIPLIAEPNIYSEIEHGVTGFKAGSKRECYETLLALVDDPGLRIEVGKQAKEYVLENRTIKQMAPQWEAVFRELVEGPS